MGVRGLTTFIKNNEKKYLRNHKLHSCTVLLDGNSVASNLYIWSNIDSAFGGDYDKFSKYVKEFFKILQKCEIVPLVIFDGGYEQRKLKTVYSRMKEKFKSARDARPLTGSLNFPLFMRIVFREVLVELNIPFAQSDFEADDELAALARQLHCPVLSNDSDFYIYDVLYIPLPTLGLEPLQLKNSVSGPKYYMETKIFSVDTFIESFGGLDKSMLPILAALLGNDYIKRSVFKAFYSNLKIPKGKTHPLQRRIKAVIEWLRNETFETAVRKILGRMKKRARQRVMRQLRNTVNGYIKTTSVLSGYLPIAAADSIDQSSSKKEDNIAEVPSDIVSIIELIHDNIDDPECLDGAGTEGNCDTMSTTEDSSEQSEDDSVSEDTVQETNTGIIESEGLLEESEGDIPDFLLDLARKGRIQSCVIDMLSLKQYFFIPQVEDYSQNPSHFISLPIVNAIVGLLMGKSDSSVRYWTRNGSKLVWYTAEPIHETLSLVFSSCANVFEANESLKKAALLEVAEVSIDLTLLPEEWHIFVVASLFWLKHMSEPSPKEAHLHTIVMCLIAIFTIDSKIGIHRNRQTFTRKYRNFLNKIVETRSKENLCVIEPNNLSTDIKYLLGRVSVEDCLLVFETLLPYHHLSEQLKTKPKLFCPTVIHAFAQFQSCLFHFLVFNSVLGFPLKEPVISSLYSGTFVYNIFTNLSKRNNIIAYIETLFKTSPTLLNLFKSLVHLLENSLTDINLQKCTKRSHKKKRKDNTPMKISEQSNIVNEEEEKECFFDENNLFSRLSLNT